MPYAPGDSSDPQAGAMPASPTNFLMAAAQMANEGSLSASSDQARSAPMPRGQPLQTGRVPRRRRNLRVLK